MTTALVTGGAGLIGSHIVDLLRGQGVRVKVLDSLVAPTHEGPPDWLRDNVEYVFGDISDRDALASALPDVNVLYHLAAFGGFAPGITAYFNVNVSAYATMLEVAAQVRAPLRRAVVASSQAVYGEGASSCARHGPFHPAPRDLDDLARGRWELPCPTCAEPGSPIPTPEDYLAPRTPYAVSKLCLEHVAHRLGEPRGIATTMLRFALTIGPRQSATNPYCGIVAMFCQRLVRGEPVLIYEDGAQTRDFIDVTDVARACVAVADDPRAYGTTLNIGTGTATTVADIVSNLAALLDVDADIWMPGWYRPGDVRHLVTDATRLQALGWRPQVDLIDALQGYVTWMRARPLRPDPFPDGLAEMRAAGIVLERGADAMTAAR